MEYIICLQSGQGVNLLLSLHISMFVVYMAVRNVEREALKYTFARYTSSRKKMEMSHRVRLQGILYSAALTLLCLSQISLVANMFNYNYAFDLVLSIFGPLQGFWNALIYMIPLFQQLVKKICKSQQNVSLTQHNQNTSSKTSLLTRLSKFFWIQNRTSKESKGNSSNQYVEEVQDESKEGEDLEGGNNRVGVLKVNNKQEEQILPVNASSELNKNRKVVMFKDMIKGEDSNAVNSSSLMLSCVEQEEADEPLFFPLSQNSELEKGDQSQLEYFSALEVNTEGCDNVEDEDNNSDDESYVDDYFRMMEIGW